MDIRDFINAQGLSDAQLAERFGFDRSYWTHLRLGSKPVGRPAALHIWRTAHVKVGPVADLTDEEIDILERFQGAA